jgi:hypothetical protein
VPTEPNDPLKILRKLVDLWRGTSTTTQAGKVPAKEQARQQGTPEGGGPDQTQPDATKK